MNKGMAIKILMFTMVVSLVWAEDPRPPSATSPTSANFTLYHDINVAPTLEFFFADHEESPFQDTKTTIGEAGASVFLAWLCCGFNKMQTCPALAVSWTDLVHESVPGVLLKYTMTLKDKDEAAIDGAVPDGGMGAGSIGLEPAALTPKGGQARSVQKICGFWCEIDAAAAQTARSGVYAGTITVETTAL